MEQYVESQQAHNPHKGLLSVDEEISQSVIDPNCASQQNSAEQLVWDKNFHPSVMSKEGISKNVSFRGGTPSAVKVSTHEDPITRLADLLQNDRIMKNFHDLNWKFLAVILSSTQYGLKRLRHLSKEKQNCPPNGCII